MSMVFEKLGSPEEMLNSIYNYMIENQMVIPETWDHFCYRVETLERYEQLKAFLKEETEFAGEEMVNGRPISIFTLKNPYRFKEYSIDCIELPAPKMGSKYSEGWEHLEMVVEDLSKYISKYENLNFKTGGMDQELNPEIGLNVSKKFQLKFHPIHILRVLEIERSLK